jgi:AcrR family transcriptional regulator
VDSRREQAIALRRAGKSRRGIKEILGITSNETLGKLLAGEPSPEWTRRPRAKDDLHAKARLLREQGYDYNRIAAELGVSKGTVSAWVHDLPWPDRLSYEECRKRAAEGVRRYWEAERPLREARREATRAAAAAGIGRSQLKVSHLHPRKRRQCRRWALLDRGGRRQADAVPPVDSEAAQSEDRAQERD